VAKLTFTIDDRILSRARRIAARRGVSLSQLVEAHLAALTHDTADAPVLRSLRGILKGADIEDYRRYLEDKYG
jgi:hypothetical protein